MKKKKPDGPETGKLIVPEGAIPIGDLATMIANRHGQDNSNLIAEIQTKIKDATRVYWDAHEHFRESLTYLGDNQYRVPAASLIERGQAADQLVNTLCSCANQLLIVLQARVPQRREKGRDDAIWNAYFNQGQTAQQIAGKFVMEPPAVRQVIKRLKKEGRQAPDKRRKK
jgi:hypothetical protein